MKRIYILSGQRASCLDVDLAVNIIITMASSFNKRLSVQEFHSFCGNHVVITALIMVRHRFLQYQKFLVYNVAFYYWNFNSNIMFPLTLTSSKCVPPVLVSYTSKLSVPRCYVIGWILNSMIKCFLLFLIIIIIMMFVKGSVRSLFLSPQNGVGPSISSSVVQCSVFLLFCISVPVLAVYFCPSSVRVVATFSGTVLFPLLCSVLPFFFPNTLILFFVQFCYSQ